MQDGTFRTLCLLRQMLAGSFLLKISFVKGSFQWKSQNCVLKGHRSPAEQTLKWTFLQKHFFGSVHLKFRLKSFTNDEKHTHCMLCVCVQWCTDHMDGVRVDPEKDLSHLDAWQHNHNRDKWANSSTYFKSNLFFFFFLAKQIIDSVKWEPFVVIFREEKRENAADALQFAAIRSCWIIMRSSATIKASWKQQFVLETLLRQWNNKPRCVGGAISSVLLAALLLPLSEYVLYFICQFGQWIKLGRVRGDAVWWGPADPSDLHGPARRCAVTWLIFYHVPPSLQSRRRPQCDREYIRTHCFLMLIWPLHRPSGRLHNSVTAADSRTALQLPC